MSVGRLEKLEYSQKRLVLIMIICIILKVISSRLQNPNLEKFRFSGEKNYLRIKEHLKAILEIPYKQLIKSDEVLYYTRQV